MCGVAGPKPLWDRGRKYGGRGCAGVSNPGGGDGREVMSMPRQTELDDLMALYEQLSAVPEPSEERRRHRRTAARGHIPATLEVGAVMPIAVAVRDMSRSGIGVFVPNPIKVGARVTVSFRLGSGAVRATCRVANCREEEGRYVVGMAFVEVSRPGPEAQAPRADGGLQGTVTSAMDAVRGADAGHVEDVVRQLKRVIRSS